MLVLAAVICTYIIAAFVEMNIFIGSEWGAGDRAGFLLLTLVIWVLLKAFSERDDIL